MRIQRSQNQERRCFRLRGKKEINYIMFNLTNFCKGEEARLQNHVTMHVCSMCVVTEDPALIQQYLESPEAFGMESYTALRMRVIRSNNDASFKASQRRSTEAIRKMRHVIDSSIGSKAPVRAFTTPRPPTQGKPLLQAPNYHIDLRPLEARTNPQEIRNCTKSLLMFLKLKRREIS